jgi:hypothetical protein
MRCSGLLGVQQAGSSSRLGAADKIACRATSVLAGPAAGADRASAEAVGEALLKRWLGIAEKDSLPIFKVGAVPGSAESAIHFLQARRRSRALACIALCISESISIICYMLVFVPNAAHV